MDAAREVARKRALEAIQAAGEKDWRAHAEWLRLCFQSDYRRDASVNVNASASATVQQAQVVITEEKRRELQERLRRLQDQMGALPNRLGKTCSLAAGFASHTLCTSVRTSQTRPSNSIKSTH
jgi:hypothetical protein